MQTAVVTGGAGFIGSHICQRLIGEGISVICVDNLLTGSKENIDSLLKDPNFQFINYDVTNPQEELEKKLPNQIDFIFHLASPASPNHHSKLSYHALPMQTMMVNTLGTLNMLKIAQKHNARFLFSSTSETYGDPLEHPQKETYRGNVSSTGPRSVYDEAKRFGETLVAYFAREKNMDARIARIFNTYGPNMLKEDRRMIVDFINQALSCKPITIFGDGKQTRSLIYISDMVEGLVRLMMTDNLRGEIINLGSENEFSVLKYAEMVKKLTNSSSEIVFSEDLPKDDPLRRRADITKAKELLSWKPRVTLEEGLTKLVEYFKMQ